MCAGIVGNEGSEKEYRPDNGGVVEKKQKKKNQNVMSEFLRKGGSLWIILYTLFQGTRSTWVLNYTN